MLTSCENDDDVCVSGEATPRLKIKFKSADNKVLTLESLYLDVDYGNNNILTVVEATKVDSVFSKEVNQWLYNSYRLVKYL